MLLDLRHLARTLRRAPASVAAAVLTLALTLGAGAAIFAVVDAVLLTPPPFAHPDALVTLGEVPRDAPAHAAARDLAAPRAVGFATLERWRDRAGRLATLEAYDGTNLTLTGVGAAELVRASDVTPGFLALLGITPAIGRGFARDDVGRPVAVVSYAFWRGTLGADPRVVGRQVTLSGQAHTIVGVLPARFDFALSASDVWRPFPVSRGHVVARLARGATAAQLAAALDEVSRTSSPPARVVATGVAAAIAGDAPRTLGLLAGAGAAAVLLAFVNLAGLLLVRSVDRRRELAVRRALGAGEAEIARQVLLEAGALVVAGVAGGVLLATWLTPAVGRLAVAELGDVVAPHDVTVSWRVIGVVAAIAAAGAGACAVVPSLAAARHAISDVLRRTLAASRGERRVRRVFVAGEVALAFALLVSVLLLGQSLAHVRRVDPGFDARGVVTMQVALPDARYPDGARVAAFYAALERALAGRLGSGTVGVVDELPLTGDRGRGLVRAQPADAGRQDAAREAVIRAAAPGYFEALRIPVVAGRAFDDRDDASAPPRVVVSAALARALFGTGNTAEATRDAVRDGVRDGVRDAVGRRVRLATSEQEAEVVGVVGDVKHRALDEATVPTVYLAARQAPSHRSVVVVRSARPGAPDARGAVIAVVREEVARLDRDLPVYGVRPMEAVVADSPGVGTRRVLTAAFLGFATLAVVLGAVGLFGVVAHDVASRRPELALRMALGAAPGRVFATTVGQGARLVGAGLTVGGVLSVWAARALGGLTVGTGPSHGLAVGAAAAAVLAVAGAVAVLPTARRAARTDPLASLRGE